MSRLVAVDLGYGFVKATDGDAGVLFSSVAARAGRQAGAAFGLRKQRSSVDDIRIEDSDGAWFIGRKALASTDAPRRSLSESRHRDPFAILLLRAALALLSRDDDSAIRLVTGLPPAWLAKSDELVEAMLGRHVFASTIAGRSRRHDLRIEQVEVLPQALGAYWSQVLTPDGAIAATPRSDMLQSGIVGVVDIGFKTTDLATIVDGDWVPERSATLDFEGMSQLQARLAERLRVEFGVGFSAGAIERAILTGKIGFGGMEHSVDEMLGQIGAELAAQLSMEIESLWQLHEYRQILIAGGGAHRIGARLVESLPSATVLEEPASANVRGYLGFGRRSLDQSCQGWEGVEPDFDDLDA